MNDQEAPVADRSLWLRVSIAVLALFAIGLALVVGYREGERGAIERANVAFTSTTTTTEVTPERLEDLLWYPEWSLRNAEMGNHYVEAWVALRYALESCADGLSGVTILGEAQRFTGEMGDQAVSLWIATADLCPTSIEGIIEICDLFDSTPAECEEYE